MNEIIYQDFKTELEKADPHATFLRAQTDRTTEIVLEIPQE